jgi:hypothetical protein
VGNVLGLDTQTSCCKHDDVNKSRNINNEGGYEIHIDLEYDANGECNEVDNVSRNTFF